MEKRVLAIEDLSCMGKCSLTVALPILSAMGCSCSVLPTALLSAHTGFQNPHIFSLTEHILPIANHWQSAGAVFEGISVGYVSDPKQAACIRQVLHMFPALRVIDPVLGDHGKLYGGMTQAHIEAIKDLCKLADVLVPNVTEAAILTGLPYREQGDSVYYQELLYKLRQVTPGDVVITGAETEENSTGFVGYSRTCGEFSYSAPKIPRQLHGTGDMFAAVLLGKLVQGDTLPCAAQAAAKFVEQVVKVTPEATPFGANFEQVLDKIM